MNGQILGLVHVLLLTLEFVHAVEDHEMGGNSRMEEMSENVEEEGDFGYSLMQVVDEFETTQRAS